MTSLQHWHSKIRTGRGKFVVEQNFEWVLPKKTNYFIQNNSRIILVDFKVNFKKVQNFQFSKIYGHTNGHQK